jgi:hypothetical protein
VLARVFGSRVRVCGARCRDSFRCDRESGAFYLSIRSPEGSYTAEQFSLASGRCVYCNAVVNKTVRIVVTPRWRNA